eukprot:TRINITY_DN4269_c0_g1_i1.p1 TRINITY_DN4269_c0_g1~~TRINITY_DN4269_c0_g1_i1.p1  ORF type:complete len:316 (+),score=23.37 TRINITY_DN4269_c0_g1_i1:76-1023(+)
MHLAPFETKKSHGIGYSQSWVLVLLLLICIPTNGSALKALRESTDWGWKGAEKIIAQPLSNDTDLASVASAALRMEDRWYLTSEGADMMHKQEYKSLDEVDLGSVSQTRQNRSSGVPVQSCNYSSSFTVLWWTQGISQPKKHVEYGPKFAGKQYCDVSCIEPASSEDCQSRADGIVYYLPTHGPVPNLQDRKDQVRIGFSMESDINYPFQKPSNLYNNYSYDVVATTNPKSDVPIFYFNLPQFKVLMKQNFPGFEERKPIAAFVARNCKALDRINLIRKLIKLGVEVDSIGTCVVAGSNGIHDTYFHKTKKSVFL